MAMQPKTRVAKDLESTFNALADDLEGQADFFSFQRQMAQRLASPRILELGQEAIPLILRRVEQRGYPWYLALEAITGIPSPAGITVLEAEGERMVDLKEVNAAWLQWGRNQGYKW